MNNRDAKDSPGAVESGEQPSHRTVRTRSPIVSSGSTHPVLPKLFADWTALALPPDWSAFGRWVSLAMASGATLASEDPAEAEKFVASLEVDHGRSDALFRALLKAFMRPEIQEHSVIARTRAAARSLLQPRNNCPPDGEFSIWERGIDGLHAYAAAAITWGVRAFREGHLMAGLLLAFSPREHRLLHQFIVSRLVHLCRKGGRDDRPLALSVFDIAYRNTPEQLATLGTEAEAILRSLDWMVCRENISWWINRAYHAGADVGRRRPGDADRLIMELLRVAGPPVYEDQLRFSDAVVSGGRHNDGAIDPNPGLFALVQSRWHWLIEGHTFGHECILWWHVFDQAFWAGMLVECRRRDALPTTPIVERFRD